jgi:hypothetical protein
MFEETPMTRRHARIAAIALAVLLALPLVGCPLGLLAIRYEMVTPPAFAVRLGDVELSGPCPPPMAKHCGMGLPYYAIWRSDPQSDGSTRYRMLYFTYLPRSSSR